jgi:hypothetical protein
MKKVLTFIIVATALMALAGASEAAIGWAGNIYPNHEDDATEGSDVAVYYQIWKQDTTDQAGQGPGISAKLYYGPSNTGPWTEVVMDYLGDVYNNDEYRGYIPATYFEGLPEVWFYCEGYDSIDASTTQGQDQNNNDPPFKLNVIAALGQDVMVYFRLCLPPEGHPDYIADPGDICVTGSTTELTDWGDGVLLTNPCPDTSPLYYEVGILFDEGGTPSIEWKYKKDGCTDWEPGGNRSVTIDDTNDTFIIPWVDHWNNYEGEDCPLCGIGTEESTWGAIKKIHN